MDDNFWSQMRYMDLLDRIATVPALREVTGLAVVDVYVLVGFSGKPEEAVINVVVATQEERAGLWPRRSEIAAQVQQLLMAGGYPSGAVSRVAVQLASQEQIDAAGGKDAFFR